IAAKSLRRSEAPGPGDLFPLFTLRIGGWGPGNSFWFSGFVFALVWSVLCFPIFPFSPPFFLFCLFFPVILPAKSRLRPF
uniref:Uncharacterized protein n=1 Tax=Castor canadensis TaxID=51338 RepID=A0A8C0X446_CASCN